MYLCLVYLCCNINLKNNIMKDFLLAALFIFSMSVFAITLIELIG
jgi:hypothetical protein